MSYVRFGQGLPLGISLRFSHSIKSMIRAHFLGTIIRKIATSKKCSQLQSPFAMVVLMQPIPTLHPKLTLYRILLYLTMKIHDNINYKFRRQEDCVQKLKGQKSCIKNTFEYKRTLKCRVLLGWAHISLGPNYPWALTSLGLKLAQGQKTTTGQVTIHTPDS